MKAGIESGMVDYGIILGLLGVASGAASLIYSRSQVVAARRQAEEATRATLLESNREISVRLQQIRSRFFKVPGIDHELQNSRPEIKESWTPSAVAMCTTSSETVPISLQAREAGGISLS